MNFGDGFPIPQEKELQLTGSWMPITPEKPIPTRSNPVQVYRYGEPLGGANWRELSGFPSGDIPETANYNRVVPNLSPIGQAGRNEGYNGSNTCVTDRQRIINHIAASYTHAMGNDDGGWNNNQLGHMLVGTNSAALTSANRTHVQNTSMGNRPQLLNLHSQANYWRESSLSHSLLHNQAHYSGSNLLQNPGTFHHTPQAPYSGSNLLGNSSSFHQTPHAHYSGSNLLQNSESFYQTPQCK